MMTNEDILNAMRQELFDLRTEMQNTYGVRLQRIEHEIFGDGKNDIGLKARMQSISDTLITWKWHGAALLVLVLLEVITFVLIALLFVKVY